MFNLKPEDQGQISEGSEGLQGEGWEALQNFFKKNNLLRLLH